MKIFSHDVDHLQFNAGDLIHSPHMDREHFKKLLFVSIVVIVAAHFVGPLLDVHDAEFWCSTVTNFLFFKDSVTIHGKFAGIAGGVVDGLEEVAEEV
jgi:hypothetical protein